MGRAIPQHRVRGYRFIDIEATWLNPVAENNGYIADVWRVEDVCTGKVYAMKRIPLTNLPAGQAQLLKEHLRRALPALHELRHYQIAQLEDIFLTEHHLNVVVDYANGGNLEEFKRLLARRGRPGLSYNDVRWLFQQLLLTLDYLHLKQPGIVQDIRLQDLLLMDAFDKAGRRLPRPLLKVSLFKLSKYDPDRTAPTRGTGNHPYVSPEQWGAADNLDAAKVDIWKAGVILYTLLSGGREPDPSAWQACMPVGDLQGLPAEHLPVVDLLRKMLQADPAQRIGFRGVKRHAWFRQALPPGAFQQTTKLLAADRPCRRSREEVEQVTQEALAVIESEGKQAQTM